MRKFEKYCEVLDACWDKPPKNVPIIVECLFEEYPSELISVSNIAFVTISKAGEGIFFLNWMCVKPEHQNSGYGRTLLEKVHEKFKGIIITKTNNAERFYKKHGYKEFHRKGKDIYLFFVTSIKFYP